MAKKYWKSQGILSVRKSGNPGPFTPCTWCSNYSPITMKMASQISLVVTMAATTPFSSNVTGLPRVKEKQNFLPVREKSGNFEKMSGNCQ